MLKKIRLSAFLVMLVAGRAFGTDIPTALFFESMRKKALVDYPAEMCTRKNGAPANQIQKCVDASSVE